jgi:RimJ/RimL family protein N-acetyltransferase
MWALQRKDLGTFIGFTGIVWVPFDAHFTPTVEIGWRLSPENWGLGFATEAANECLAQAFGKFGLKEVVSMTTPANIPSVKVMKRLGMTRDPKDDFDHPNVADGSGLKRHILYRIQAQT